MNGGLGERAQRPHDVNKIFDCALGALPHILIAMRELRERAGMDLDRLRQIERDPVAPGREHRFARSEDRGMPDERVGMGRTAQQASEPLGASPVETALAERCRCKSRIEVCIQRREFAEVDGVLDDAIAMRVQCSADRIGAGVGREARRHRQDWRAHAAALAGRGWGRSAPVV